ncbi:MAG: hypothetical protein RR338_02695 [Clostridia bacterium]
MEKIRVSKRKIKIGFSGLICKTDENILDFAYSPKAYNFTFRNGALKGDIGVDEAKGYYGDSTQLRHTYPAFPEGTEIYDVLPYMRIVNDVRDDRLVVRTNANKLFYTKIFENDTWHEIVGDPISGRICSVNYNNAGEDVLIISSDSCAMRILAGEKLTTIPLAPKFTSIAVHFERVYGTVSNKNEVWFSDDFNPTNWKVDGTAAGYIKFNDEYGGVLKVVSFLNYLYIFREHAIFRLTAYANQAEFTLNKLFTETGRIYKPTIAQCGDKILFMAEEGLFSFDGYSVTRIGKELPPNYTPFTAVAAYQNNCYYLACKIVEPLFDIGVAVNNMLIEYNLEEKTIAVLAPLDILSLVPVNIRQATDLIVLLQKNVRNKFGMLSDSGKIFGVETKKMYFSPYNSLGDDSVKTVRSVTLMTKNPCLLKVKIDGVESQHQLVGSELPQTVFVERCGQKIGFTIETSAANAHISQVVATIETR